MKSITYSIFLSVILTSLVACNDAPLPNTYLIPADCSGRLRIILEDGCGTIPKVESGRRMVAFTKGEVLVLNTMGEYFNTGEDESIKDQFYMVDSHGRRSRISLVSNVNEGVRYRPSIVNKGVGVSAQEIEAFNSETKTTSGGAMYLDFDFYNSGKIEPLDSISIKELDDRTNALIDDCRGNRKAGSVTSR